MTTPSDGPEPGSQAPDTTGQPAGGQYWQSPQQPPQFNQPQFNQPQLNQQQFGPQQFGPQQFGPSQFNQPQQFNQQYSPYQGYPGYQRPVGTNGFAIAALICGIVFNVLGIIFGFVALNQIRRTGEQGRGLAIAGIWVGAASLVLTVVWIVFFVSIFTTAIQQMPTNP
jgi:hypothetical protein